MQIVLASTSRWRLGLLQAAGVPVRGLDPAVDEAVIVGADAVSTAAARGRAKALAVAPRAPGAWVIGADQVVHDGAEVFGKPLDPQDHLARLRAMRGRTHELVTAWTLVGPGPEAQGVCTTRMEVRDDLTDAELRAYVAGGEGSGCAGGYAAEGHGAFLFRAIDGDWFNVIGLPLLDVLDALRARGWRYGGT